MILESFFLHGYAMAGLTGISLDPQDGLGDGKDNHRGDGVGYSAYECQGTFCGDGDMNDGDGFGDGFGCGYGVSAGDGGEGAL